ncbi:hypothetical protein EUAN_07200 [Andreesenia angusta]|uniref:Uncharacterized protein n=1 Tax=Andreesenia angusta TaxID=39480 RepID=A0A1S1V8L4_9FIRM|nr:hypothetical protein [Andreesenia angusta]OHW62936.1 hypothetical protein EUAN_07200 [Andreesenia angusta]
MTREEIKKRVEHNWKVLNEDYGIYTMEELDEAIAKLPILDISCMTAPIKSD